MSVNIYPTSKYKVGDMVLIKSVKDCRWGSNEEMKRQIGRLAQITRVIWRSFDEVYEYKISGEAGNWAWCDRCFENPVQDLPEFEAESIDAVFDLFS